MATKKPKISSLVASQLPKIIRDDYPTFVLFLETYYEYLEQNKTDIIDIRSIDNTLDKFIENFKNELSFTTKEISDSKFLLKRISDLYLSKGNESSYKLLFRLLFNKEIDIVYPGKYIFKPSDGKWKQDISIFVEPTQGDVFELVGQEITINTIKAKIKNIVSRVRVLPYTNLYEVFLEKSFLGAITDGTIVEHTNFIGTVKQTVNSYRIFKGGKNFKIGQVFNINTQSGSGTKIKIAKVSPIGAIEKIEFIEYGYGYVSTFNAAINNVTNVVENFNPFADTTNIDDAGYISSNDYIDTNYIDNTYIGTVIREFFFDSTNNADLLPDSTAIITFDLSGKLKYTGYWETNESFTSDSIYLQDSNYYQIFSYVIKVSEQLDKYKDFIKEYVHPAGLKMFGEYTIENQFRTRKSVQSFINSLRIVLQDIINIADSFSFNISKTFADSYTVTDAAQKLLSLIKTDSFNLSDADIRTFTKVLTSDEVTMEDVISVNIQLQIILSDTFDTTDTITNRTFTKNISELALISESLGFNLSTLAADSFSLTDNELPYSIGDYWSGDYNVIYNFMTVFKTFSDSFTLTDLITGFSSPNKVLLDTLSFTESNSFNIGKVLSENISLLDTNYSFSDPGYVTTGYIDENTSIFYYTFAKGLSETTTISDGIPYGELGYVDGGYSLDIPSINMQLTKYIMDNVTLANSGTIYKNYYTSSDYWSSDFSEGVQSI